MNWYLLEGVNPEPWEAPEGSVGRAKGSGKFFVQMHSPVGMREYQEAVKSQFKERYPEVVPVTYPVTLTFHFWRQRSVEAKANIADATNLQKATEDALQGLLYMNDRQVYNPQSYIVEQLDDTPSLVLIGLSPLVPVDPHIFELIEQLHIEPVKPETNIRRLGGDLPF